MKAKEKEGERRRKIEVKKDPDRKGYDPWTGRNLLP